MALSTWWAADPVPVFPPLAGLQVRAAGDLKQQAHINNISLLEASARRQSGHTPYVAYLDAQPAGYGWVATRESSIGELSLNFSLPPDNRYLWDFATLPGFRGRGIYPRLLQGILQQEGKEADCFWIIHAPENLPSRVGIDRAGFEPVGQLSFRMDGGVGLQPFENLSRAQAGADLLGVPLINGVLSPCWCCGGASEHRCGVEDAASCWPPLRPEKIHPCTCGVAVQPSSGLRKS
jgi:GNAT superfamily N-acetyltransferase